MNVKIPQGIVDEQVIIMPDFIGRIADIDIPLLIALAAIVRSNIDTGLVGYIIILP